VCVVCVAVNCVAVCRSVLRSQNLGFRGYASSISAALCCSVLCCSMLHCVAVSHCVVLQCVVSLRSRVLG